MEKEYGLNKDSESIAILFAFTDKMEELVPKDRIIEVSIAEGKQGYAWEFEDAQYEISDNMIEEWIFRDDEVKDTIQRIVDDL